MIVPLSPIQSVLLEWNKQRMRQFLKTRSKEFNGRLRRKPFLCEKIVFNLHSRVILLGIIELESNKLLRYHLLTLRVVAESSLQLLFLLLLLLVLCDKLPTIYTKGKKN